MTVFNKDTVLRLHRLLSGEAGTASGVRDPGLIESAICSAYQTFGGEDLFPTAPEKAAKIAFSLISNHAFLDGNKRIGILAMLVFLELSSYRIEPTDNEIVDLGLSVARGDSDYNDILNWIKEKRR